jgi:hypothetical protein
MTASLSAGPISSREFLSIQDTATVDLAFSGTVRG